MKNRILSVLMTLALLVSTVSMVAIDSAAAHPFTDVPEWADEFVAKVYEKGIMQGTGGTTFGSDATLTREQLVVTLYRISGSTITGTLESLSATFADAADISDWAYSAVEWASKEGITAGVKEGDKLNLSASKINIPMIKTKDGGIGYVKVKLKDSSRNVAHSRLSFTGSRNFSIQDNVLGILSYEGNPEKTGHQTTIVKNGFDPDKYGSVNWSGPDTEELYYYSIEFPN